jgi:opacity protein-like surface antigen
VTHRARHATLLAVLALPPAAGAGELHFGLLGGYADMSRAPDSAAAVFNGSTGGASFGAEAGYAFDLGVFFTGAVHYLKKDGERVFVAQAGGPVFRLGHPLSVRIVPVALTGGYRFLRGSLVSPYVGLGLGLASYREESTVGGIAQSQSESKLESHALAGVVVGRGRFRLGVEGAYSRIPDTIGIGGVSKLYGEDDVGGWAFFGKLIFTLGD